MKRTSDSEVSGELQDSWRIDKELLSGRVIKRRPPVLICRLNQLDIFINPLISVWQPFIAVIQYIIPDKGLSGKRTIPYAANYVWSPVYPTTFSTLALKDFRDDDRSS